jgi:hypothetical protein
MNISSLIFGIVCLSLLCVTIFSGCRAADSAPSLSEVEKFDAYRVYYAGDEIGGLPLEEIDGKGWGGAKRSTLWTFVYGACDPPSGLFAEGGCQPPLQIQSWSICRRWPGNYAGGFGTFDFRGTKASWRRGRGFEVYAGRTTVVIFGSRGSVLKAARQLRDVRQASRPSLLPPPVPGSLQGKLTCQRRPS